MKNENKKMKSAARQNTKQVTKQAAKQVIKQSKKAPQKTYRVKCREYDALGRGIVSFNGSKIPVAGLLRGEMAHMTLKHTKDETIGCLTDIEEASENRVSPACGYHKKCGACQLMHMSYEEQLYFKEQLVQSIFCKNTVRPIIGMENPYHYRNKVHATFGTDKKGRYIAGFYKENSHRIIDADDCMIQNETANAIVNDMKLIAKKLNIRPYNEDKKSGILRHVLIRTGLKTGQVMVVPVIGSAVFAGKNQFVKQLLEAHPEITTIVINYNSKKTSMILGDKEEVVFGNGYIEDELCGCRFQISPKSFYQVNPVQTEKLYNAAIKMAQLSSKDRILDAYSGIGTISLIAAGSAASVTGVEINKAAVHNAKENSRLNNAQNVNFICEDAGKFMHQSCKNEKYDVVFIDPPRSGCDKPFINSLIRLNPERIVYISCNPVTQKRDTDILAKAGYQIEDVQPVDMFGMSYHVETVVLLSHKKPDSVINKTDK